MRTTERVHMLIFLFLFFKVDCIITVLVHSRLLHFVSSNAPPPSAQSFHDMIYGMARYVHRLHSSSQLASADAPNRDKEIRQCFFFLFFVCVRFHGSYSHTTLLLGNAPVRMVWYRLRTATWNQNRSYNLGLWYMPRFWKSPCRKIVPVELHMFSDCLFILVVKARFSI